MAALQLPRMSRRRLAAAVLMSPEPAEAVGLRIVEIAPKRAI